MAGIELRPVLDKDGNNVILFDMFRGDEWLGSRRTIEQCLLSVDEGDSAYTIFNNTITCHNCGMTSHHPKDIEEKYCGHCHAWHNGFYGFSSRDAYQAYYSNFENWAHEAPAMEAYSNEGGEMSKAQMLKLIDDHKNKLIDPVAMLNWTWLRVFIAQIPDREFDEYMIKASEILSR